MADDHPSKAELLRENEELRYRLEDAEETIRAIQAGEVDAFVVAGEDRHEVFTLETADRPYRLFVENMHLGAVTLSEDGTILFCNNYFAHLLRRPAERLTGAAFRSLVAEKEQSAFDSALSEGQGDVLLLGAGGIEVCVALSVHELTSGGYDKLACLLVADLTSQRHYEHLLRTQAALLDSEAQLRETTSQLRDANRRKDEFLATLAHELRNPLAPIRSGLELMKLAEDDPKIVAETRHMMERQVAQMVRLIDDLLDVSRITRGQLELRTSLVTIEDIVRDAVEASRPFIDQSGHQLIVRIADNPIQLRADPNRLAQVLANLLINAAKFTPAQGRIELIAERQADEAVLTVKDNGIGIPTDMREPIFEMFTQVDRSAGQGSGGLGIGLTLVKQIVAMHGGTVRVSSPGENQGSEFQIRLPIPPGSADGQPAKEKEPVWRRHDEHCCRVLVVDDNAAAADLLSMLVKMQGHEVRTAGDGMEALTVAGELIPDVVLMDLGMPRMNGFDAARLMRQQPWGEHALLVALTGWGESQTGERAKEAGFDRYLVKPADPAALQAIFAAAGARNEARAIGEGDR